MKLTKNLILLSIFILLIITGCNSEKSNNHSKNTQNNNIVSGLLAKGPIKNSIVEIRRLDTNTLLARTKTNDKGKYSVSIGSFVGAVSVFSEGGKYIDEIDGQEKDATNVTLKAISVVNKIEGFIVNITPITSIAVKKLEKLYLNKDIMSRNEEAIIKENKKIAKILTGEDFNPTKITPNILGQDEIQDDTSSSKYGLLLASFAKLTNSDSSEVEKQIKQFEEAIRDDILSKEKAEELKDTLSDSLIQNNVSQEVKNSITQASNTQSLLDIIRKYIEDSSSSNPPTLEDYLNTTLSNINANNLDEINTLILSKELNEVSTLEQIQVLINSTIDTTAPSIVSLSFTSNAKTYVSGDDINISVVFNENVIITNTPSIDIKIGNNTKQASYVSGSGASTLVFTYTVVSGDEDINGIEVLTNTLVLNTGSIKDVAGNSSTLTHSAISQDANRLVDATAPSIVSLSFTSNAKTYVSGDDINISVVFNENVIITNTPSIDIKIGNNTKQASYVSGSGASTLVFTYTVVSGDEDTNGIEVLTNTLVLNTGSIKDVVGNSSTLTHSAISQDANRLVDTTAPSIVSLSFTSNAKTYVSGDDINISVVFNENVIITNTPSIDIKIGNNTKQASYVSGSGASTLVFTYTVVSGDVDINGIEVLTNTLVLNTGSIKDVVGNSSTLTHSAISQDANRLVDTTAPSIVSLSFTSNAKTYVSGDDINISVVFNENVIITNTPSIDIKIGNNTKQASYVSGSGASTLVFTYTVVSGDEDINGIEVLTNTLVLNTGSIKDVAGNSSTLTHSAISQDANRLVDATAPSIVSLSFTSNAKTYVSGDDINISVVFNENVIITNTPSIDIKIGNNTKQASYVSGSGASTLVFTYTVVSGDEDTNGIEVLTNTLVLNTGSIKDVVGNSSTLTHSAISQDANRLVDTTAPNIVSLSFTSNAKTYVSGDDINISVVFNENVIITNTPSIDIKIGNNTKQASYVSGSGASTLVFTYTVVSGDVDINGIEVLTNTLVLNTGSIKDVVGNSSTLTHSAISQDANRLVDTTAPNIVSLSFTSNAKTYVSGDDINISVVFNENVIITNTPSIDIKIGNNTKQASYVSGSGASTLVFTYTVVSGDVDINGIEVLTNTLVLNTGSIKDVVGNSSTLTHSAISQDANRLVDATAPSIVSLSFTSNAKTYVSGDDINISVVFNENVIITNTPSIDIKIGNNTKQASYVSGSGASTLVFTYTVVSGDEDTNGIEVLTNTLVLNTGSIKDVVGNSSTLTHSAISQDANRLVDATAPSIVSLSFTSNAKTYVSGDDINISVVFNENVIITNTPSIDIKIGNNTKQASYVSGSGASTLVFTYTVVSGDVDINGIEVLTNTLVLNTGSIKDVVGNSSTLTHSAISQDANRLVDATAPSIVSLSFTSNAKTYVSGDDINISVVFNENVIITNTPSIDIKIGNNTKQASYVSGSGASTLVFTYTVVSGDVDINGIEVLTNTLVLNTGSIKDVAGNSSTLTHSAISQDANRLVDATAPSIVSLSFTSNAKTYVSGDDINISVVFNENVIITNTPSIDIKIGNNTKQASYVSGSGASTLVFTYTVVSGDEDINGIEVLTNTLVLNTGSIKDVVGNSSTLTHSAISQDANRLVDATAPSIVSLSFTSNAKTYVSGDDINISVVFNENVIITNTPSIDIKIGNNTKQASYVSGSGASTLVFTYTVVSGDEDTNGIEVLTNTLVLNTGSIKDVVGNSSTLTHSAISQDANRLVDTTAPSIVSLSFTSNAKTYVSGDDINISVVFNENVIITNTPSIDIKIGNNTKQASYVSGSGASTLVFTYTVVSGDVDINGIEVLTNTLVLNTGSIKDVVGNSSTLTHSAISQDSSRKVYTPILNILSHTNNQNISIKDAFNIILSGTSNVEGKGVIISHNGTELETATVLNTTWTANSISFLDGKSRTYINGGVVSTDVVLFHEDKEQSLKAILDRNKSSTGTLDYSVHPQDADGKYISIKFPNTYVKGVYRYYNRTADLSDRVEGSTVKFLLNDIILWTSKGISNAGNIVTITPPEHIVFDEVKIVFSGWDQNFREIEVDGIPFEKNFNLVLKVTDDTNTETVENLNLNIGLNLASTSVNEGDTLDAEFANSQNGSGFVLGLNKSPQLTWGGASSDTTSYAIIMDDTTTGASNWIHWNVFNIPVSTTSLVEHWSATHANADVDGIQQRTAQGITNPLNKYVGPWPPAGGGTHTYQIKVYALKSTMPILDGTNIAINTVEFEAAHAQHIINSSILNFNYTNP